MEAIAESEDATEDSVPVPNGSLHDHFSASPSWQTYALFAIFGVYDAKVNATHFYHLNRAWTWLGTYIKHCR